MIYLRMRASVKSEPGQRLCLVDVADVLADASLGLEHMPVAVQTVPGVWKLDAMGFIRDIHRRHPAEEVVLLGSAQGVLTCEKRKKTRWIPLRVAVVFALLLVGSAMAITWFHADVNMMDAQQQIARIITGREVDNPWLIALPYALGVGSGVAFFYALVGRGTVSPLDIKLSQYRQETAQQRLRDGEAKHPGGGANG